MSRHLILVSAAMALVAGAGRAHADGRNQVMDADRAFAKATSEKGLEGWMSFMADDAVRVIPLGGKASAGKEAIRKLDAGMFADPKRRIVWEPTDGGVFADGKHGFTTGRAKIVTVGREKADGPWAIKYVTIWRKGDDGSWKVILDTGSSEAPKP